MTAPHLENWLNLPDRRVRLDDQGFLHPDETWDEAVAAALAAAEGVALTASHWELIHLVRDFHAQYRQTPAMRALVRFTGQRLGADKGNSRYLLQLFPDSPARRASRIAGLPRPEHCL